MEKIKVIDLFSGAGGLSNGFEQTGRFEVVGAVELDKWAAETYRQNHSNPDIEDIILMDEDGKSDITKIDFSDLIENKKGRQNNLDRLIVIGGPPCQGFSNANRQKNYLISGNNLLVLEFVRAIRQIEPIAFLMENVKNIISNKHKFYVTNHIENKKYTSKDHIETISDGASDLFKPEELIIVETDNVSLKNEFGNICEMFNDTNKEIFPIIYGKRELTVLRKLQKLGKNNEFNNFREK